MHKTLTPLKIKKLKSKGWKVGTFSDFLKLSEQESNRIKKKLISCKSTRKTFQENKIYGIPSRPHS